MGEPLIQLRDLRREFPSGEGTLAVLKDVNLEIAAGEMVAIVGASGSGKSTLMNILGCLDRPTSGSYRIAGRETAQLAPDELAALRREHFGFIFQRYHLLGELTALGNVEIPAIYAGATPGEREKRAGALLDRLGMANRTQHRPGQLSGGQQQRVSIARALMNGGAVILADEPTGALDSHSGEEVLRILDELNAEGRTVIIVTHDMKVAARAGRIIQISDGEITSDRINVREVPAPALAEVGVGADAGPGGAPVAPGPAGAGIAVEPAAGTPRARGAPSDALPGTHENRTLQARLSGLQESLHMAVVSMLAHRMRTFLTMLGIIIGIASVICVVALGEGSRQKVLANISGLGTNTLEIFAGRNFGDTRSGKITTLVVADANELAKQPYVAAVTPTVSTTSTVRFDSLESSAQVIGVGAGYFDARGTKLADGRFFDQESVATYAQDAVIDENTRKAMFSDVPGGAIGRIILVGKVPCRIIGVTQPQQGGFGSSQNLQVYLPYTTVQARFLGTTTLRSITVKVSDDVATDIAEQAVDAFLLQRHGTKDFFIINTDDIRQTITSTTQTLALLIAAIAVISLVVGGIGVMNIMLVSVSERVSEIGVRMAVGARRSDILEQFLIEAVLVCLIGGLFGVGTALAFGVVFNAMQTSFTLIYSMSAIVAAVVCASLIGVVFGYLPARNASLLDPVEALARD